MASLAFAVDDLRKAARQMLFFEHRHMPTDLPPRGRRSSRDVRSWRARLPIIILGLAIGVALMIALSMFGGGPAPMMGP